MIKRSFANDIQNHTPIDKGMILPSYSGVAFLLSWIYLLFYANSAGIEAAAPISLMGIPYTVSSLMMSIVVLDIAFGPSKFADRIMTSKMKVISSTGTSLGTLFMICADPINAFWLLFLGAFITGVFSGILAQQWVIAYKRVGIKTTMSSFPALLAVSTGICMTIMYLPQIVILITTVLMPIISGFMLHSVRKSLFPVFELETLTKDRPLDFVIILFPISIFAFSSGFLDFFSYQSGYTYFFYLSITAILLIAACVFIVIANRENSFKCIILPVCFFICVFVPFFTMFSHMPAANFISIGELGIEIALFSIAVGFADFFSISALKSYALCRVAHVVLSMAGWYVGALASSTLSDLMYSQASLAIVFIGIEVAAVCLIVAIVKAQKVLPHQIVDSANNDSLQKVRTIYEVATLKEDASTDPDPALKSASSNTPPRTTAKVDEHDAGAQEIHPIEHASQHESDSETRRLKLGREHGLSDREMDVFTLLAQGYSASAIGSELYIAQGTVNYHTRNIYSKLNVHSKQELISLVAEYEG